MLFRSLRPSLAILVVTAFAVGSGTANAAEKVTRFARFSINGTTAYGVVEGDTIRQIDGDLYGQWRKTDKTYPLASVKLLVPTNPKHVLALAGNYRSHIDGGVAEVPEKFHIPQPFFKSPGCLVAQGENVVIPPGTEEVHYEAEMVVVIGKRARNVSKDNALDYVLGVTCGNDISARDWQKNDVQWWRAKGSRTFGPCGPIIVSGLDYDNLVLQLRQNGEVRQKQSTKDLIHGVAACVSFISQHLTLEPGDLIFTGTPGKTAAIKPGDKLEVELEGVGVLSNPVASSGKAKAAE